MTAFRFTLEAALRWRRQQLEAEEQTLMRLRAELERTDRARQALKQEWRETAARIRGLSATSGSELADMAAFEESVLRRDRVLAGERERCASKVAAQWAVYSEAKQRTQLLERLREKRFEEWRRESERQLETLGTEAFLSRFGR